LFTNKLIEGAKDCFIRHGGLEEDLDYYLVPGAFEIPFMAKKIAQSISLEISRSPAKTSFNKLGDRETHAKGLRRKAGRILSSKGQIQGGLAFPRRR